MIKAMTPEDQDHYDEEMDVYAMEDVAADFCDWFMERSVRWYFRASEWSAFYDRMLSRDLEREFHRLFGR
jgi:hypothetical protein